MTLWSYWRSGAAHRVRIALELKGVAYQIAPVDLRAGAQKAEDYRARNPQALVPTLEVGGHRLTQSLAIIEWLDERYPTPPLLPDDPIARAQVRAAAAVVACDVHPLGNLRVLNAVRGLGADEAGVASWARGWITSGFEALERLLEDAGREGPFAFGPEPGLADCTIAPQLYAAQDRYAIDLAPFPRLAALDSAAQAHPAFIAAHPLSQPDAPES
ncbi:MAG: maleylacetoacetate isomerase [Alphaproteobacteria bacterium]|nr:maleylacetoacetate isomerase [Alphaproteobacteria bacterium]